MFLGFLTLLFAINVVHAAPIFGLGNTDSNSSVSTLSTTDTNGLIRPTRLAQVSYCWTEKILNWTCGPPCDALPGIRTLTAGGDDGLIPIYYIAYDPIENSVIVSHRGTDTKEMLSIANDLQFGLVNLDQTLFPNASPSIQVHDGFQKTFARTAALILGNVTAAIQSTGATKVEVAGHSLGAAIAMMDAVYLRQHLDPAINISTHVLGLPRGGNQAWANLVDSTVPGFIHIHNKNDPIGTVPPRFLNFQHPSGELHIQSDGSTLNCSGQENQNNGCIDDQNLFAFNSSDHNGPYYSGIHMGGSAC